MPAAIKSETRKKYGTRLINGFTKSQKNPTAVAISPAGPAPAETAFLSVKLSIIKKKYQTKPTLKPKNINVKQKDFSTSGKDNPAADSPKNQIYATINRI
ncbi:hypothetical protein IT413_05565 [Candidatus Peregrinibacteria bacterium]|nr:hypothetical protein [Candidatus Peregrinibacteria bacterium]